MSTPALTEFAAAVEAAKRGEVLPESPEWQQAVARLPRDIEDSACDRDEKGRPIVHGGLALGWRHHR